MGCLNSTGQFEHWFGNVHLSGPCNAKCYFCIGQHMQAVDALNVLDTWPLPNLDEFASKCRERNVREVFVTGTNTDPLLYRHLPALRAALSEFRLGARTNGLLISSNPERYQIFDKVSVSIPTLNRDTYAMVMGTGAPPPTARHIFSGPRDVKINMVLLPETRRHIERDVEELARWGVSRINLREPYGQPHVGNPFAWHVPVSRAFGMPQYKFGETLVTYWDVHYVEVESVNLYANGFVSETYPITRGVDFNRGRVIPQREWTAPGRQFPQWQTRPLPSPDEKGPVA